MNPDQQPKPQNSNPSLVVSFCHLKGWVQESYPPMCSLHTKVSLIEKGLKLPPTLITEKVASKPEVCSFPLERMQPSKVVGREFSFTETSGSLVAGMQPPSDRNQDPVWNPGWNQKPKPNWVLLKFWSKKWGYPDIPTYCSTSSEFYSPSEVYWHWTELCRWPLGSQRLSQGTVWTSRHPTEQCLTKRTWTIWPKSEAN